MNAKNRDVFVQTCTIIIKSFFPPSLALVALGILLVAVVGVGLLISHEEVNVLVSGVGVEAHNRGYEKVLGGRDLSNSVLVELEVGITHHDRVNLEEIIC